MSMSKDEFQTLVSTEIATHGEFVRNSVYQSDLPAFIETASELNAEIHYFENTEDELYTAKIKQR